jgi:hypothetical protein
MKDHFYLQDTEKLLVAWRFVELKLKPILEKFVGELVSSQLISAMQYEIKSSLKAIEMSHPNRDMRDFVSRLEFLLAEDYSSTLRLEPANSFTQEVFRILSNLEDL